MEKKPKKAGEKQLKNSIDQQEKLAGAILLSGALISLFILILIYYDYSNNWTTRIR